MKPTRDAAERIIGSLTEHDADATCADPCRKHSMSGALSKSGK
jgi:putative transposase